MFLTFYHMTVLDWSKSLAFADGNLNVVQKIIYVLDTEENIV